MADDDWYRSRHWDEEAQAQFWMKLGRMRSDPLGNLRIKANAIAADHPEAALELLNQYIKGDGDGPRPSGHYDRAIIMQNCGRIDDALHELELLLGPITEARPVSTGGMQEAAYCLIVALAPRPEKFADAQILLDSMRTFAERFFQRDYFNSAAESAQAFLSFASGDHARAAESARIVLAELVGPKDRIDQIFDRANATMPRDRIEKLIAIAGLWDEDALGPRPVIGP